MLYQITADDLRYTRRQQWAITYYILLLIAAVIAFHDILFHPGPFEKFVLVILAFFLAVAGTLYLITLQRKLSAYRNRLKVLLDYFSEVPREMLLESLPDYTNPPYYLLSLVLPFILVMFVAAAFTAWFVYR